eukprot:6664378-Alexandrium_andersonii.AAC.1
MAVLAVSSRLRTSGTSRASCSSDPLRTCRSATRSPCACRSSSGRIRPATRGGKRVGAEGEGLLDVAST